MKRLIFTTATLFAAGCNSGTSHETANTVPVQNTRTQEYQAQYVQSERMADFVGPRGADGPVGPKGETGPVGATGMAGVAVAGQRGPEGAAGATGAQGPTGARGATGDLARGPAGATGAAGAAGAQGDAGQTGVRGASGEGSVGPAGPAGRTGPQGPAGDAGAKGPTLVGPAGPAGRSGAAGEQGLAGPVGAQGSTTAGVAGAVGAAGGIGPQGETGPIGPQGPTGVVQRWTEYREFWFDAGTDSIHPADQAKVAGIATYMNDNPSLQIGIDSSMNTNSADRSNLDLATRRGNAVRDALVQSGVASNRITSGTFDNVDFRRDGRVELLFKTDQLSQSQPGLLGPTGVVEHWTNFRDFWFDSDKAILHPADAAKVADIATYVKTNPTMRVGIDSSLNPLDINQQNDDLSKRRSAAIRTALIAAGVPASNIRTGTFGDTRMRRDGRVEVLVISNQFAAR